MTKFPLDGFIDITIPISPSITKWPGGHGVVLSRLTDKNNGDFATSSRLDMDLHSGSHIDAPLHHIVNGKTTGSIDLKNLCGPCLIVDCTGVDSITKKELLRYNLDGISRILFKTDNSELWQSPNHEFHFDYCALSLDAAQYLCDIDVNLVGIDYLSIQKFHDSSETHEVLLKKSIVILETINLLDINPGLYDLLCIPMNIKGVEAAMCRVLIKPIN